MDDEKVKTLKTAHQGPREQDAPDTEGIEVIVTSNKLECWLKLSNTSEGKMPEASAVQKVLEEHKISKKMIKNDVLERMFDQSILEREILIAEGTPKKDGKDGSIKYHFNTDPAVIIQKDEKGKVDFKETGFVQQVKKGDLLVELVAPEKGENGLAVTGEVIEAKEYAPKIAPMGKNTAISEKNSNHLVAAIDGLVTLKKDKVNIDPVLIIDGDVDYSSGNVDFDGGVIVKGGIKAGFSVKSVSEVTVKEVVEDAFIETEGNVVLKSGFVGHGEGKINAGGDVILAFVENQNIYAGKDIHVSDALLHSTVQADGKVIVSGKKGIIGGSVTAHESIEAQSAGSQAFTKTILRIGLKRETLEKIEQYKTDVQTNKANTIKIDTILKKLEQLKRIKKGLPPKEQAQYVKVCALKKKLTEESGMLENTKHELDEEYSKFENAFITVKQSVYPGVTVEIGNQKMTVKEHFSNVTFRLSEGEIRVMKKVRQG